MALNIDFPLNKYSLVSVVHIVMSAYERPIGPELSRFSRIVGSM